MVVPFDFTACGAVAAACIFGLLWPLPVSCVQRSKESSLILGHSNFNPIDTIPYSKLAESLKGWNFSQFTQSDVLDASNSDQTDGGSAFWQNSFWKQIQFNMYSIQLLFSCILMALAAFLAMRYDFIYFPHQLIQFNFQVN